MRKKPTSEKVCPCTLVTESLVRMSKKLLLTLLIAGSLNEVLARAVTRTGAILPQCRSCHIGKISAMKLNHYKPSDLYQPARVEIDSHLQKSIAASLTNDHTRGGASMKSYTCRFVHHPLTALQHQFLSKVLGT